ncbi:MFS transporter [Kitasatospora sp. NBC_01302]|uniref:MFS transporter n=1 Tax=Kitasatospora sp. NBC_01302 TaxID=2903575 RepID=UPI002E10B983|nr:MFS transporter [Kitasatospora sp. NBC_01302]
MSVLQQPTAPPTPPEPTAPAERRDGWRRWTSPVAVSTAVALLMGLLWARLMAGVTADLSAQFAWADFVGKHPGSAYDFSWYGGMHPASYSVLAPWLMALFGVRTTAVAAAVLSTALLAVLLERSHVRRPLPAALWGAFALTCDIAAGRVTFALGLMFGLAAVVVAGQQRRASWWRVAAVALCALLATTASPVAGLFVDVAAAALLLTRRYRTGWAMAVPPPVVVLGCAALFPFFGVDPISASTAVFSAGTALVVALLVPRPWRAVRLGALVYALGSALTLAFPTPIGMNVQRLALIFGGVVLLALLGNEQWRPLRSWRRVTALVAGFGMAAYWTITANIIGIPTPSPTHQADALVAELQQLHAERARVEAVPMLNHYESWRLADVTQLARGWNRQADVQRNPLFYDRTLTPASYHDWLQRWAVGYVALPSGPTDIAGDAEAALVRGGLGYLEEVWHDEHWRLFRFTDAQPLADGPATVLRADAERIQLTVGAAGQVQLRIPYSPWLTVHGPGGACLSQDGDWTRLTVTAPGDYQVDARYRLPRGSAC